MPPQKLRHADGAVSPLAGPWAAHELLVPPRRREGVPTGRFEKIQTVSATTTVDLYAVAAAALALWLLVRYPRFGPRRLRTSIAVSVVVVMLVWPLLLLLESVRHSEGRAVALRFVALPLLTGIFWTSGCLMRAAVGARRR